MTVADMSTELPGLLLGGSLRKKITVKGQIVKQVLILQEITGVNLLKA